MTAPASITHRGYSLDFDMPPIPSRDFDWTASPVDFDGPEDVRPCFHAATQRELIEQIDCWYLDQADEVAA